MTLAATTDTRLSSVMRLTNCCQPLQRSSHVRSSWRMMKAISLRCSLLLASQVISAGLFTKNLCLARGHHIRETVNTLQSAAVIFAA